MEEEALAPFGSFMQALPHPAFIAIHSVLIVVGFWLSRKSRAAGYGTASNGFLLFVVAELSYITYHAGLTHFLFAHIIAEVCDVLALVTIGFGLSRRAASQPVVPGAVQHR
jgi:phosphotransferase system  glucose/maltose/N-acetylglucosamine-specific IIC component